MNDILWRKRTPVEPSGLGRTASAGVSVPDKAGRLAVAVLIAVCIGACTGSAAAPGPVRAVLDPLTQQGYSCAGPTSDQSSSYVQWTCSKTDSNKTDWHVVIDGNESGIRQIVGEGVAPAGSSLQQNDVDALFGMLAAMTPSARNAEIPAWVASHANAGGQEQLGSVFVQIQPGSGTARISLLVNS